MVQRGLEDKELERQQRLWELYLRNMSEVKRRVAAIDDILFGRCSTTYRITNMEFCVLQIRKILELIALSALVSDADLYCERLDKIEKMWNARLILRDIGRIHPDFYPQPIEIVAHDDNRPDEFVDVKEGYLTEEKFIEAYGTCGKYLHQSSPFVDEASLALGYEKLEKEILEWRELIIRLLSTHIVRLYDSDYIWYTTMNAKDKEPSGNIFKRCSS